MEEDGMGVGFAAITLLGIFFALIIYGAPLFVALIWASFIVLMLLNNMTPSVITQKLFMSVNNFGLLAVPFFMIAGGLLDKGGISKRLVNLAMALVGWLPGSLAVVTFLACAFFGAVSGSSIATVAAIGGIMLPIMLKEDYPLDFALSTCAAGGYLGIIIPPSIPMVLYGLTASVPVGDLFMGGFIPGIMLTVAMSSYAIYWGSKNKAKIKRYPFKLSQFVLALKEALWALAMPVIILGGIYGGIFTPTEAAAVACAYGLLIGIFVFKELNFKKIISILRNSVASCALILFMIACVSCFGHIMAMENIPRVVSGFITSIAHSTASFWVVITIILFIVGMVMDTAPAILILGTLIVPISANYGIDPVVFGLVMIINLGIGLVTPPVGMNLYVAAGLKKVGTKQVLSVHLIAYVGLSLLVLILLMSFPKIITSLPELFS
jgi:C4-dicarboxylate transporter DctM subunit